MPGAHNKPLQTDERRAAATAFCKVTLAPLAAERQAVELNRFAVVLAH